MSTTTQITNKWSVDTQIAYSIIAFMYYRIECLHCYCIRFRIISDLLRSSSNNNVIMWCFIVANVPKNKLYTQAKSTYRIFILHDLKETFGFLLSRLDDDA